MNYLVRHFDPWEVFPHLAKEVTWATLDPAIRAQISDEILETGDAVRDLVGLPCLVNDYHIGGDRQFCGVRTKESADYSPTSRHAVTRWRRAGALDLHFEGVAADDVRTLIRKAVASGGLPHLGGLELDVPWVHIDDRPRQFGRLVEFAKPKKETPV